MTFDAWGLVPIVLPLVVLTAARASWLALPAGTVSERVAASAVLGMAFVHASVGGLAQVGWLSRQSLLVVLVLCASVVLWLTRRAPRLSIPWKTAWPELTLITLTVGVACLTARIVPIWQWDAFGYHLPYVNLVLQSGGFAEVPPDLRYITTYPHNIELGMIWLRAMLPDDRLVDLAQVPYGVAGAALAAAFARKVGASRELSLLAAAVWLTLPSVFLQLPTNYVDIGTAAALLGALYFLFCSKVSVRTFVLGGLALGLFLGSKPAAPLPTAVILGVTALRSMKARAWLPLVSAVVATLWLGSEMYWVMLIRHGNPVWPVELKLGPLTLPGEHSVEELLAAGSALPRATGSGLEKVLVSWLAIDSLPVFDMRVGGLGLTFLLALPLALVGLIRRRQWLVLLAAAVALISPDPAVARYVLAFPVIVLALAAAVIPERARWPALAVAALTMLWQVAHAWPGLVGDGPSWSTLLAMNDDQRRTAVGPHGQPTDYPPAWERVGDGEAAAFDTEFEFPGLLWTPDLRYPVYAVPRQLDDLHAWLDERNVRLVAVGPQHRVALEGQGHWERLFDCRSADCTVFVRR